MKGLRTAVAVAACGVALRIASTQAPPLVVAALVAVFMLLARQGPSAWLLSGGLIGLIYGGALIVALAKWGTTAVLVVWLAVALAFALFFGALGLAATRVTSLQRPLVVAGAWTTLIVLLDQLYAPVLLTAPLAVTSSTYRLVITTVGVPAAEGLVVLAAAALAWAWVERRPKTLILASPILLATAAAGSTPPAAPKSTGLVHVVQPDFRWTDYAARGWSLEARDRLRTTLDELTQRAALRGGGTIVWPENGSGVADAQLRSRTDDLRRVLHGTSSDLVVAGLFYSEHGRHVAATHIGARAVGNHTFKSNLVPIAESNVKPGPVRVLSSNAGPLGISICFDILFGSHVRKLVARGAELLVVSSDNASFGPSLLPKWHIAYAIMRAAEAQRSLVFVANRGPSVAFDINSNATTQLSQRGERGVHSINLGRNGNHNGRRHLVWTVLLCLPLVLIRRPRAEPNRPGLSVVAVVGLGVLLGPFVETADVGWQRGLTVQDVLTESSERAGGRRGLDVMASHFRQSEAKSCGRAALAYALSLLGDRVFEEDFATSLPIGELGSTLYDLKEAAGRRGFRSEPLRASSLASLDLAPGRVALLHLQAQHYVVASSDPSGMVVFDPATGLVRRADIKQLNQSWSGAALRLSLQEPGSSQPLKM